MKIPIKIDRIFNKAYEDRDLRNVLRPIISDPAFKRSFGDAVVDRIVERTEDGKDYRGISISTYAPYSKSYRQSLEFKVYGKTSKVNMKLTGEMLSSIVSRTVDGPNVVIEFDDSEQEQKALGHISGQLGRSRAKPRIFFDILDEDLIPILKEEVKAFRSGSLELLSEVGLPTFPGVSLGFGDDTQ